MFRENFLSASIAGVAAALILTLLQTVWITPLILQAETYEGTAEPAAESSIPFSARQQISTPQTFSDQHEFSEQNEFSEKQSSHEHHAEAHDHASLGDHHHEANDHHHANEWKPADGLQRTLFTLASDIVMGLGYALLLIGVYTLWRRPTGAAQGLLFGLAGFVVFFAAPGLGLPPELPGTKAAELTVRQQWWIGTAVATATGLALIFIQKNWIVRVIGVAVLIAPHMIGAPHPAIEGGLAPADLQTHFRLATVITNAVFWLVLGAISAIALKKFSGPSANELTQ
ncbi:MAG: CbtA family protein [Spongiibacteraceae bacterium]